MMQYVKRTLGTEQSGFRPGRNLIELTAVRGLELLIDDDDDDDDDEWL